MSYRVMCRCAGLVLALVLVAGEARADEQRATIRVPEGADGVRIRIDGECPVDAATSESRCEPLDGGAAVFVVDAGVHRIVIRRESFATETRTIDLAAGAGVTLRVTGDAYRPPPETNPHVVPMAIAWAVAATGAVATIGSVVALATTPDDEAGRRETLATTRNISLVVTAVALGAAAYFTIATLRWRPSRVVDVDASATGLRIGVRF